MAAVVTLTAGIVGSSGVAVAASETDAGQSVSPAQPYLHNPNAADWIGSYDVAGAQAWSARFALVAPDTADSFTTEAGTSLTTKFGAAIDTTTLAEMSYLVWRYADTTSNDDAAAIAHLINGWTAAPTSPSQLDPSNDFLHIAYDAPLHLAKLSAAAKTAVTDLQSEAAGEHGPWTITVAPPAGTQVIQGSGDWRIDVFNHAGTDVPGAPVTLTATDASLPNGTQTEVIDMPASGPLQVPVRPTGPAPRINASIVAPSDAPAVLLPSDPNAMVLVTSAGTTVEDAATGVAIADRIVISPPSSTIAVGQSQNYNVNALAADGSGIGDVTSGTTFAISPDGSCAGPVCTADQVGVHTVTATYPGAAGRTASATLTVTPASAAALTISPANSHIAAGVPQQFIATTADGFGNAVDVTDATTFAMTGGSCTEASCTTRHAGRHLVGASYGGLVASAVLRVTPAKPIAIRLSPHHAKAREQHHQKFRSRLVDRYGNRTNVTGSTLLTIHPDGRCGRSHCSSEHAGRHRIRARYRTPGPDLTAHAILTVKASPRRSS